MSVHDVVSDRYPGRRAGRSRLWLLRRLRPLFLSSMQPGQVIWDTEVRGFGVRYRSRDRVYLVKTRIKGQQRILTIGRHGRGAWGPETARREAQRLLGRVQRWPGPGCPARCQQGSAHTRPVCSTIRGRICRGTLQIAHTGRSRGTAEALHPALSLRSKCAISAGRRWRVSTPRTNPSPSPPIGRWRSFPPSWAGPRR